MGYFISQRLVSPPNRTEADRLRMQLEDGTAQQRRQALLRLVALRAESALTCCLASADGDVIRLAQAGLWECWLNEAGPEARHQLDAGIDAMNAGTLEEAAAIFTALTEDFPEWAEAINKLATVQYLRGQAENSIKRCLEVVALKPDHFGAWNGLTICAVQIENWPLAHRGATESLRLIPHSTSNQQLLRLVESRLPSIG